MKKIISLGKSLEINSSVFTFLCLTNIFKCIYDCAVSINNLVCKEIYEKIGKRVLQFDDSHSKDHYGLGWLEEFTGSASSSELSTIWRVPVKKKRKVNRKIKIDVTVNGKLLPNDEFFATINEKYKEAGKEFRFEEYGVLNRAKADIRDMFRNFRYSTAFKKKYGMDSVDNRFRRWLEEKMVKQEEKPSMFFSEAKGLIESMLDQTGCKSAFISEGYYELAFKGGKKLEIKTYKDYLKACISLNYRPPIDIRLTAKKGWGVYATKDIMAYTFFGLYVSEIRNWTVDEVLSKYRRDADEYLAEVPGYIGLAFSAEKFGNFTRFINSGSGKGNVDAYFIRISGLPHIFFVSNVRIYSGKEIVWKYGAKFLEKLEADRKKLEADRKNK